MKLTIKKQAVVPPSPTVTTSSSSSKFYEMCCNSNPSPANHLIRCQSKQQQSLQELVRLDCLYTYSKLLTKCSQAELQATILRSLSTHGLKYESWIGYLCAHCCHHFHKYQARMTVIGQFVAKFRAVFEISQAGTAILAETLARMLKYCSDCPLVPSQQCLQLICAKYQETLLLEFIPLEYSQFMLQRFMAQDGDIEQYIMLCVSLVHFVLLTLKPTSQSHLMRIMQQPFMGTVEWPIVIANRYIFQA